MIRKKLLLCSVMVLSSIYALTVSAGNTTSNIGVKMQITNANCIVNGGKGISGTYNLPLMNDGGKVIDSISYIDVPLIIDCTKGVNLAALTISFTATKPGFQNAANGLINTTMANIALLTRWKYNGERVIDLSATTDLLAIKDAEVRSGVYDSSLKVYPVNLNPSVIAFTPGQYHADLSINITHY
ncbi:type 1 fimbrial protein [Salmonella enterica subsp. enterica serovar Oslo]|nr:type 1 fimbrial protein [Salmonella enterica subsp. enterica serovar Oslo]